MKNYLLLILLLITFVNSYSQNVKYFDENNVELSKSYFYSKIETIKFVEIPGDSDSEKKLVLREESGKIEDVNLLYNSVQKITGRKVDFKKPIVIIYYPGPDICNSSGTSDENSLKIWHKKLEKELFKIAAIKPDYIYKNSEGLKSKNVLNWNKDSGIIEKAFFVHHYLCQSFVVISPDGNFLNYFGEFPKDYLLEATKCKILIKYPSLLPCCTSCQLSFAMSEYRMPVSTEKMLARLTASFLQGGYRRGVALLP